MRIGLMVGSDRERPRPDRLKGLIEDGVAAEHAGLHSFWFPQVPGYLDAMTAVALLGASTTSIELGTAVVPVQTRHPLILAQQAFEGVFRQVAIAGRVGDRRRLVEDRGDVAGVGDGDLVRRLGAGARRGGGGLRLERAVMRVVGDGLGLRRGARGRFDHRAG